jgi:hypothetical protein
MFTHNAGLFSKRSVLPAGSPARNTGRALSRAPALHSSHGVVVDTGSPRAVTSGFRPKYLGAAYTRRELLPAADSLQSRMHSPASPSSIRALHRTQSLVSPRQYGASPSHTFIQEFTNGSPVHVQRRQSATPAHIASGGLARALKALSEIGSDRRSGQMALTVVNNNKQVHESQHREPGLDIDVSSEGFRLGMHQGVCKVLSPASRRAGAAIIAIDNDECIGSWVVMSMLFGFCARSARHHLSPALFARMMADALVIRPGVAELFETVMQLRHQGYVHSVVMCTAASNRTGWVSFLRQSLETWFATRRSAVTSCAPLPALVYDHVITGDEMEDWLLKRGLPSVHAHGCMIKDMDMVRETCGVGSDVPVVMIDDRPGGIVHGVTIPVPPFEVGVDVDSIAKRCLPDWADLGQVSMALIQKTNEHRAKVLAGIDKATGLRRDSSGRITCRDVYYDGTPSAKDLSNAKQEQEVLHRVRHRQQVTREEYDALPLVRAAKQVREFVTQHVLNVRHGASPASWRGTGSE